MQANQARQIFTITAMARVFGINRRAYYAWRQRQPQRDHTVGREERAMKRKLRTLHAEHRGNYDVNRMTVCMKLWYPTVGRRRIYRFMKELGIQGKTRRRAWRTTVPDHRPHGIQDHVQRNFSAAKPRQLVVCDATAIPLRHGVAYLAVVLDVYSRKIVGWAIDPQQTARLMVNALKPVIARGPCDAMICHTDQGTQYTSRAYRMICQANEIRQSVGSVGDCYDNAMMESFFATLKTECVYDHTFETFDDAAREIGAYINDYYNCDRLHSSIGYRTPNDVERAYKPEELNL